MSDDVARAVGAGGKTITIAGKKCKLRPLSLIELAELERDCLEQYQDKYLSTFYRNQKLLNNNGESNGNDLLFQKMEEVARWDVTDLPPRFVYDPDKLFVNSKLQLWLKNKIGFSTKGTDGVKLTEVELDKRLRMLTAGVLEQNLLTEEEYKTITAKSPEKMKTGHVGWWTTGSVEGRISMLYICFKDSELSREEIAREIGRDSEMFMEAVREIENMSVPAAGNG